jgi:hypothetical protein
MKSDRIDDRDDFRNFLLGCLDFGHGFDRTRNTLAACLRRFRRTNRQS